MIDLVQLNAVIELVNSNPKVQSVHFHENGQLNSVYMKDEDNPLVGKKMFSAEKVLERTGIPSSDVEPPKKRADGLTEEEAKLAYGE